MTVASILDATLTDKFLDALQKMVGKAIKATTGTAKAVKVPQFHRYTDKKLYVEAYNTSHPKGPKQTEAFGAPAFAVLDNVHVFEGSPDWAESERKIVSTLVHEFIHAVSHEGHGLQEGFDEKHFGFKSATYCFIDEAVTDLYGYLVYSKMNLAKDGKYETGYVSNASSSTTVGATDGSWLSFPFLLPIFDGKRLAIVKTYFHGTALDKAADVPFSDYIKAGETLAAKKKLGFSFKAQAQAIDDRIAKNAIAALIPVVKNAIPVAQADAVLAICAGKGKDKEKPAPTGEIPATF